MKLTSPDFSYGEAIPRKYAVEGENISPPLSIKDVPASAKSLALLVEDPDVPREFRPDGLWTHWLVWNMPTDVLTIPTGALPEGIVGLNTRGVAGYGGPNPPNGQHRYFFRLFALDTILDIPGDTDRTAFLSAVEGHIIEESVLMGTYVRSDFQQ